MLLLCAVSGACHRASWRRGVCDPAWRGVVCLSPRHRFFYTTKKNPTNIQHKLGFRKYDPVVRQHVLFTEQRIKRSK
jgi:large subunit ribosomal protein L33